MVVVDQEQQMKLDDKKWFASQRVGYDLAGAMDWCNYCQYQSESKESRSGKQCTFNKTRGYPCAQAYSKMEKPFTSSVETKTPQNTKSGKKDTKGKKRR